MSNLSPQKMKELRARGYEILDDNGVAVPDRVIDRKFRREEFKSRPKLLPPDPLPTLIKQLVSEIQSQAKEQVISTEKLVNQVGDAIRDGLKESKPEPAKPKEWNFKAKRTKEGFDIKAKEVK